MMKNLIKNKFKTESMLSIINSGKLITYPM